MAVGLTDVCVSKWPLAFLLCVLEPRTSNSNNCCFLQNNDKQIKFDEQ